MPPVNLDRTLFANPASPREKIKRFVLRNAGEERPRWGTFMNRENSGNSRGKVERQAFDIAGRCVEIRTTRGDAYAFKYTAQVQ